MNETGIGLSDRRRRVICTKC